MKIITQFDMKPIPERHSDWTAMFEGYEPGGMVGWGSTEAEAIEDLQYQFDDKND